MLLTPGSAPSRPLSAVARDTSPSVVTLTPLGVSEATAPRLTFQELDETPADASDDEPPW